MKAALSGPKVVDLGKVVVTEASDSPPPVISGAISQGSGVSRAPEASLEDAMKVDPTNRKLEMPVFKGWNPEGWIF